MMYQIQRRPAYNKTAEFRNYRVPYKEIQGAIRRIAYEERHFPEYEWKLLPTGKDRKKGTYGNSGAGAEGH